MLQTWARIGRSGRVGILFQMREKESQVEKMKEHGVLVCRLDVIFTAGHNTPKQ